MRYSLRTLFVLVTLVAIVIGARIEYLRRWATFHERLAAQHASVIESEGGEASLPFMLSVHGLGASGDAAARCFVNENHWQFVLHQDLASAYRRAMYRPWTTVREPASSPR